MPVEIPRRSLLSGACAWFTVACAASAPQGTTNPTPTGDTGSPEPEPEPYPCGQEVATDPSWSPLPLADFPELGAVGGWVAVTVGGRELVIAQVREGCFAAIVRACAHEGAAIDYRPERQQFVCPLHGAVYAADGAKVAGPAPTGLPTYPCGLVDDIVYVKVA